MKKIISTLLFVCIALFASAYDFMVDGIAYNINIDGTSVTLTYEGSGPNGYGYSNLSGVLIIPSSVTDGVKIYSVASIDNSAFSGCSGLSSVTVPNSVTSIGNYAFSQCTGLTTVTIGNSVTSIGNYAFSGCSSLTTVNISDIEAWCNISFYNDYSNPLRYAHNLYLNGYKVTDLVIPNTVTTIRYYAFSGCSSLTSLTIPNSVTSIGFSAFSDCSSLLSVFWNAKTCDIQVGINLFAGCTNVQSFIFGNEVENIPANLCGGLTGLTSITIPNSVTSIGASAFSGCNGLTSITIPNSVTSIGASAFNGCSGLNTAIIGENVTSIGQQAFMNCSFLENLVAMRERPIIINSNVFGGVPKASCDLHVRQGSKIRYENQDVWKDFLIIVEDAEDWADVSGGGSSGVYGDVNGDGYVNAVDVTIIYNILLANE